MHASTAESFLSLLIRIADCMQSRLEKRLNGCQIFGWFAFSETESEPIFGFPHNPSKDLTTRHIYHQKNNNVITTQTVTILDRLKGQSRNNHHDNEAITMTTTFKPPR